MPVIAVIPSVPFNSKFKQRNIHFQTSNFCMARYVYKVLYMLSLKHGSNITPILQRDKWLSETLNDLLWVSQLVREPVGMYSWVFQLTAWPDQ